MYSWSFPWTSLISLLTSSNCSSNCLIAFSWPSFLFWKSISFWLSCDFLILICSNKVSNLWILLLIDDFVFKRLIISSLSCSISCSKWDISSLTLAISPLDFVCVSIISFNCFSFSSFSFVESSNSFDCCSISFVIESILWLIYDSLFLAELICSLITLIWPSNFSMFKIVSFKVAFLVSIELLISSIICSNFV